MPRIEIAIQEIPRNGSIDELTFVPADSVNNHQFQNSGNELVIVRNEHPSEVRGYGVQSVTASNLVRSGVTEVDNPGILAGFASVAGTFAPDAWNQPTGKAHLNVIGGDANMDYAVIRFQRVRA